MFKVSKLLDPNPSISHNSKSNKYMNAVKLGLLSHSYVVLSLRPQRKKGSDPSKLSTNLPKQRKMASEPDYAKGSTHNNVSVTIT